MAMNRWDLATKKWEQNTTMCSAQSISKKMLHRSHPAEHSVWAQIHVCRGVHRVTDLEKFPVRISKMKLRRHCQQLGLCLFPSCHSIFLEPCQVRGVSVFFVVFTLAFTTGQTSSGSLPFIGCFILFSQFIRVCFIIRKDEKVLFVLVQQTSDFVASLGYGLGLGQLPVLAIHCFFSLLALLFLELYRSFTMYE